MGDDPKTTSFAAASSGIGGLFVFANLEPNAPSLATYFDGLLEIIADSGIPLETLQLGDKLPLAIKAITPHA